MSEYNDVVHILGIYGVFKLIFIFHFISVFWNININFLVTLFIDFILLEFSIYFINLYYTYTRVCRQHTTPVYRYYEFSHCAPNFLHIFFWKKIKKKIFS